MTWLAPSCHMHPQKKHRVDKKSELVGLKPNVDTDWNPTKTKAEPAIEAKLLIGVQLLVFFLLACLFQESWWMGLRPSNRPWLSRTSGTTTNIVIAFWVTKEIVSFLNKLQFLPQKFWIKDIRPVNVSNRNLSLAGLPVLRGSYHAGMPACASVHILLFAISKCPARCGTSNTNKTFRTWN